MKFRLRFLRIATIAVVGAAAGAMALSACGSSGGSAASSGGANLTTVTIGTPNAGFSPQGVNYLVASRLGYFKQQGLQVNIVNFGSVQAMQSALATGKIDFATYADTFFGSVYAQHQDLHGMGFYEFAYPFKYGIAVNPSSNVTSMSQLSGQTIGTVSFNQSDYLVGQKLLAAAGATNNHWIATGIGAQSGRALQTGKIAALAYSDTGFGQILGSNIPLRFLPLPSNAPDVGGQIMVANDNIWEHHRQEAAELSRAISEASVYTLANPTAAAYQYLESYPTTAPAGEPLNQQLAAIEISVVLRARLFTDGSAPLGTVSKENVDAALSFVGGNPQTVNVSGTYSNSLISYANDFSAAAIQKAAKNFKVPGLNAPVKLPTFPAGTP
jgi:ABC-type nitrate/sulfonate/bicarbonate transport system substrate-binding protein